jgi:histidine triad (HIT) family protein
MSEDCIFCQIIDGEIPSYTVYEDDKTYAFLDANPLSRGHTLVIPKQHYKRLNEMSADKTAETFGVINDITPAVESAVNAPATTIALHNGEEAGQEVPHVHWHIVPQFAHTSNTPIHALFDGADVSNDEMESIAESVRGEQ